jgi:hypothetical protein
MDRKPLTCQGVCELVVQSEVVVIVLSPQSRIPLPCAVTLMCGETPSVTRQPPRFVA